MSGGITPLAGRADAALLEAQVFSQVPGTHADCWLAGRANQTCGPCGCLQRPKPAESFLSYLLQGLPLSLTEKRRRGRGAPPAHPRGPEFRGQPSYARQPPDRQAATVAPICVRGGTAPPPEAGLEWERT